MSDFSRLSEGCFSIAFQWNLEGRSYVVKYPLKKEGDTYRYWLAHMEREILFLNIYAHGQCSVILPKIMEVSDTCVVQTKVDGIPLTEAIWQRFSPAERQKIVRQLAGFFRKLHRQTDFNWPFEHDVPNFEKCFACWDADEIQLYRRYSSMLNKMSVSTAKPCLCITDWKDNHILYNPEAQTIGWVDFGSAHLDFPENEFVLKNPIRSHLSLEMMRDIIDQYNRGCRSTLVSWERIKCHLVLYALNEVYGDCVNEIIPPKEKKRMKKILFDFVRKVEVL